MLQVSDAYKELVKSNIRPKCEPIVKVSGKDNNGNEVELIWNAKNIKDLKYKRSIDPVGRELPYMELTWTEIYTGKLNSESYPEKYNNITKYMQVELSFVQDLDFYSTWKTIFNGGLKWSDLLTKTWKRVKKEVSQETITMPKLFLSAKPTISGQTITWVARDLISFINETQTKEFRGDEFQDITLKNAISYFVLNARGGFVNSRGLFNAYTNSATNILSQEDVVENIDKRIICVGNTNNIILNLLSVYNYYFDFSNDIITLNRFNPLNVVFSFNGKVLYKFPTIKKMTNISSYLFKNRIVQVGGSEGYEITPTEVVDYGETDLGNKVYYLRYVFDGYGEAHRSQDDIERLNEWSIDSYEEIITSPDGYDPHSRKIYVVPVTNNSYDNSLNINSVGEVFNEDNPINPYDLNSQKILERKEFLCTYFSDLSSNIEFESLANVAIETNDVIEVDTNLFDDNGKRIIKKALVVYVEFSYNGSLKQKIKAHEVI